MRRFDPGDPKVIAAYEADFAKTDFGKHVLQVLSTKYNDLHQAAEQAGLSAEAKAFLVERAAGVKNAIDVLTANALLQDAGLFQEDAAAD